MLPSGQSRPNKTAKKTKNAIPWGEALTKFTKNDAQYSVLELPNGRFQGKIVAQTLRLGRKRKKIYLCPETDATREEAEQRAIEALYSGEWM